MSQLSWAVSYEGSTDARYLDVLIRRVIEAHCLRVNVSVEVSTTPLRFARRSPEHIIQEATRLRDAFDVLFVHADAGGREQRKTLSERCLVICRELAEQSILPTERCVPVIPRREMEAWAIADQGAVAKALGYNGRLEALGLPTPPKTAESINDPKDTLRRAQRTVVNQRRRLPDRLALIAEYQSLSVLRRVPSFKSFDDATAMALSHAGILT